MKYLILCILFVGGLQLFEVSYKDIDFSCDFLSCTFDNKKIFLKLHENESNIEVNFTNVSENNVRENNNNERQVNEIENKENIFSI